MRSKPKLSLLNLANSNFIVKNSNFGVNLTIANPITSRSTHLVFQIKQTRHK